MSLSLIPVTTFSVELKQPIVIGETPAGMRLVVPVAGGRFEGPKLSGTVLGTGSDWNAYRPREETMEFWARYDLRTDDEVFISFISEGLGHVSSDVLVKLAQAAPLGDGIFKVRTRPRFEAPLGSAYAWLNRSVFVGEVHYPLTPTLAVIDVFEVA